MKKKILTVCFGVLSFTFYSQSIEAKIREVYADKSDEYIFNFAPRLAEMTDIVANRVKVLESIAKGDDKYVKLSTVGLLNKYNPALTYDTVFDPVSFNPLKYNFDFNNASAQVYRVDHTNYIIVIEPKKTGK